MGSEKFDTVTFRDNSNNNIALPSATLLGVHAAIARILHMSGAGEYIERVLRNREGIRVLAEDGSTDVARLLLACWVDEPSGEMSSYGAYPRQIGAA